MVCGSHCALVVRSHRYAATVASGASVHTARRVGLVDDILNDIVAGRTR